MNIRQRVHNTYVEGFYKNIEVSVPGLFGSREVRSRYWVPEVKKEVKVLEYLDPKDMAWKEIPTISERTYVSTDNDPYEGKYTD